MIAHYFTRIHHFTHNRLVPTLVRGVIRGKVKHQNLIFFLFPLGAAVYF